MAAKVFTTCKKCNSINWSSWISASTRKLHKYCKTWRQQRANAYSLRKTNANGSHSKREWLEKLAQFENCPVCKRSWHAVPSRPDKRYRYVWTKDHIIPLNQGSSDNIENIQPLCYQCNFGKR